MTYYFLRHAHAVDSFPDESRELSGKGEKQSKVIGKFLRKAGITFDACYSSPLVRAEQTAKIVLKTLDHKKDTLQITKALLNETSQGEFDHWLKSLKGFQHILLVGHAPTLATRARKLLDISSENALELPKAGLVAIEEEISHSHKLKFFISPSLI
jgi:phosphohistidine phosphatase